MELIVRAAVIYVVLFLLLRASGNRQFSRLTSFDIVVLILVAETAGQALVGEDYSLTAAIVAITAIVAFDILISLAKARWQRADQYMEGIPVILVDRGHVIERHLKRERVDRGDILQAAREKHGLERFDEINYAVLESDGSISIIPFRSAAG
jgi:uncharacterized membrane protein YcaP (DUF421 family)